MAGTDQDAGLAAGFDGVTPERSEKRNRHQRGAGDREGCGNGFVHDDASSLCASSTATATARA